MVALRATFISGSINERVCKVLGVKNSAKKSRVVQKETTVG